MQTVLNCIYTASESLGFIVSPDKTKVFIEQIGNGSTVNGNLSDYVSSNIAVVKMMYLASIRSLIDFHTADLVLCNSKLEKM